MTDFLSVLIQTCQQNWSCLEPAEVRGLLTPPPVSLSPASAQGQGSAKPGKAMLALAAWAFTGFPLSVSHCLSPQPSILPAQTTTLILSAPTGGK